MKPAPQSYCDVTLAAAGHNNDVFLIERAEAFHALEVKYGCKMRIYGSVATGIVRQDSDVDVLVNFNERVQWAPLWYDLGLLFEREVDLVIEKELMKLLRERIIAESRTIDQLIAGDRQGNRMKQQSGRSP